MSTNPIRLVSSHQFSLPRRRALWEKEGMQCHWCQQPTRFSSDHAWDVATTDHVIPRYKGGTNDDDNLVSACNRCNNRRNHEDISGLPEGSMLGKYKSGQTVPSQNVGKPKPKHVALTADEKKNILSTHVTHRPTYGMSPMEEQRNQALKEIKNLRNHIGVLESDAHLGRILANDKDATIADLTARMESMTVLYLIRKKLAAWLLR